MDYEPRSSSEPPASVPERTDKALRIECDYNTNCQTVAFYSARECSYDELRAEIRGRFKLTRPFRIQWDDDGEKIRIEDESTLDQAIEYHLSDEVSVTLTVKITPEYDESRYSCAPLPTSMGADSTEGHQVFFAGGESSSAQQGGDAVTTSSQNATGKSTQNFLRLPLKPSRLSNLYSDCRASSTDDVASGRGLLNGSTDGGSSYNPTSSARRDLLNSWMQNQGPHPIMNGLDTLSLSGSESLSLSNTHSSMSDGHPDTGNPPEISEHRGNFTGSWSSGPARDSEYEAQVNGSHFDNPYNTGIAYEPPVPQDAPCCSECDCFLEGIKYTCTTCAAAAADEEKGRSRESSSSPTRTVLGRRFSGSSSSTARVSYELCDACFARVGVYHSSASGVNISSSRTPTPRELGIARRSAQKEKGQLRHAFVEKFWDRGWRVLEHEKSHHCSGCQSELSPAGDQYKCGVCDKFTICRACYSGVHDIHPIHPFLEIKEKPASQTSDGTSPDDNADEPSLKHPGVQCFNCQRDIVGALFHCVECKTVNIDVCSNCDSAGLPGNLDASDGGHHSSHRMLKIPMPLNRHEIQDISQRAHGQHHGEDRAVARGTSISPTSSRFSINTVSYGHGAGAHGQDHATGSSVSPISGGSIKNTISFGHGAGADTEEDFIHDESCDSCEELIIGVRYQCLNCPSKPTSYNLCSNCEVKSYRVHDPMHAFLKLPRLVDIPDPLESESPIIPILYRYPAGPASGSASSPTTQSQSGGPSADIPGDPEAYLRNVIHKSVQCDGPGHAGGRIVGKWYRCAFCAKDLCADCETIDTHDSTHAFLVLKARVNDQAFRQPTDSGNPDSCPPILRGNIYYPQHE